MAVVQLKGLRRHAIRRRDGTTKVYWYAWRGGPPLEGDPGSPEFLASYTAAIADQRRPPSDTLAGLCVAYEASPNFRKLSAATRKVWGRWLGRIREAEIGSLPQKALNDRRVRADLLDWRDTFADRPRTADYAVQVLHRVLWFGVDRGKLDRNPLDGVEALYTFDRSDKIWLPEHIEAFTAAAGPHVARALRLACSTGFRRADLVALTWGDVGDLAIVKPTSKSRERRSATVPLIAEARAVLDEVGRGDPGSPVLQTIKGGAWTADGFSSVFQRARDKAGLDLHLHDARGTFVTRLRLHGLTSDEIADVTAWKKKDVERLLAIYVDREAVVKQIAGRLARNVQGA